MKKSINCVNFLLSNVIAHDIILLIEPTDSVAFWLGKKLRCAITMGYARVISTVLLREVRFEPHLIRYLNQKSAHRF